MKGKAGFIAGLLSASLWGFSLSFVPFSGRLSSSCRTETRSFAAKSNSSLLGSSTTPVAHESIDVQDWYREVEIKTAELLKTGDEGKWDAQTFEMVWEAMEMWSRRPSRKSAINLERLLRRVIEERIAGNTNLGSVKMIDMYNALLQIWAKSGEKGAAQRAEEILDNMQASFEAGDIELKPDIKAFNLVLLAYSSSKGKDSPRQAMRVLQKLQDLRSTGKTDVLPNTESFSSILKAHASAGGPDASLMVLKLIQRMEKLASQGYAAVRPDYKCHNVYLGALLASMTRENGSGKKTAMKAESYLFQMINSDEENSKPDVWSWNMVISAWSKSGARDMTDRAESLVSKLEEYHAACSSSEKTQPNTNTYNCLIACYSRSNMRDKAQQAHSILKKMKERHHLGFTNQRPDAVTYNSVMNAYAKSMEEDAPQKVEDLLREMHTLYEETGDRWLKPSSRSFNTCFDAWAKSSQPQAAERIMDWIQHMEEDNCNGKHTISPNKWTYNAYLEALSKVRRPSIGDEAESVLETMDKQFRKGRLHLKPDVLTFTNVIHCIALSGADDAFERAYAILSRMENLHASGYGDVRPNTYTYNCVINAVAKSKLRAKAKIAVQMLQRMKHVALRPLTITYNNILNACAFSNPAEDDKREVLDIAMRTLQEAQETCGANFITYGTCLRVIGTFEEDPIERWRLARKTFRSCCDDGQLTSLVMNQIKFAVSPSQYSLILQEATDEGTGRLRTSCTQNVRRMKSKPPPKNRITS